MNTSLIEAREIIYQAWQSKPLDIQTQFLALEQSLEGQISKYSKDIATNTALDLEKRRVYCFKAHIFRPATKWEKRHPDFVDKRACIAMQSRILSDGVKQILETFMRHHFAADRSKLRCLFEHKLAKDEECPFTKTVLKTVLAQHFPSLANFVHKVATGTLKSAAQKGIASPAILQTSPTAVHTHDPEPAPILPILQQNAPITIAPEQPPSITANVATASTNNLTCFQKIMAIFRQFLNTIRACLCCKVN